MASGAPCITQRISKKLELSDQEVRVRFDDACCCFLYKLEEVDHPAQELARSRDGEFWAIIFRSRLSDVLTNFNRSKSRI